MTQSHDPSDDTVHDPDTLPSRYSPDGKCPRCCRVAHFELVVSQELRRARVGNWSGPIEYATILKCQGYGDKIIVAEYADAVGGGAQHKTHGVMWWPTDHLGDLEQAVGVPTDILAAYSEGVRCLAVHAPNAAVAMFRTVIAQIVEEKGSPAAKAKGTLFARIEQMVQDKSLWDDFGDWAHHVRDTGNAGAHGEKFDPVDLEQATELQKFVREMIYFLYVQPARRAAARPATKRAAPPSPTAATPNPGRQQ